MLLFTPGQIKTAIENAIGTWEDVLGHKIKFEETNEDAEVEFYWEKNWIDADFIKAQTIIDNLPSGIKVKFNDSEEHTFSAIIKSEGIDNIEEIALHEMGHVLGLIHKCIESYIPDDTPFLFCRLNVCCRRCDQYYNPVMANFMSPIGGPICKDLKADDKSRIKNLYEVNVSCPDSDFDNSPDYLDCEPNDDSIYPGAPEICWDSIDQDCDREIDGGCPLSTQYTFTKVVDVETYIPNGTGKFIELGNPSLFGDKVAFRGVESGGQGGIYLYNIREDQLEVVANENTIAPGGTSNFTQFEGDPSISDGNIAFYGSNPNKQGIYNYIDGFLDVVANTGTSVPGGDGDIFFSFRRYPSIYKNNVAFGSHGVGFYIDNGVIVADTDTQIPSGSGEFQFFRDASMSDGNVAFRALGSGQDGIYLYNSNGGQRKVVADLNTAIPRGTSKFTSFKYPSISKDKVVFYGTGVRQEGIYFYDNISGERDVVADENTVIPGRSENFSGFDWMPSISGERIAFKGKSSLQGIYISDLSELVEVIKRLDTLDGKTVLELAIGSEALYGNKIAFKVRLKDVGDCIYIAHPTGPIDSDNDGVPDETDNCPDTPNSDQANLDGDEFGDVCDLDADGDGYEGLLGDNEDCEDLVFSINPGAPEICNDNIDNNCNNQVDEGCQIIDIFGMSLCNPSGECNIQFAAEDPNHVADSISVTGPKIVTPLALTYEAEGPGWWYSNLYLGQDPPTPPVTYTFHIIIDGIEHNKEVTVQSFVLVLECATNPSPAGTASGDITFTWTPGSIPNALYYVQFNGWNSSKTTGNSIPYTGPPLMPGTSYGYCIATKDPYSNECLACENFVYTEELPSTPTGLDANYDSTNDSIWITWDDMGDYTYNLYWGTETGVTKEANSLATPRTPNSRTPV